MIVPMIGLKTHTMRTRTVAFNNATGEWEPTASVTTTFRGSFQPLSGREREQLPEGYRNTAREKLYSTTELKTSTTTTSPPGTPPGSPGVATLMERRGAWYEVVSVEDWRDHDSPGLPHFKYILALRDVDDLPE